MITMFNKYFENYMSAGDDMSEEEELRHFHKKLPTYKDTVLTFLNKDFKKLLDETKQSYDWDKFIDNCKKAEKLPYVCASNLKDRLINMINKDTIKEVSPNLLNYKPENIQSKTTKPTRPKERYLKPRPESSEYVQEETKPTKTINYSDRNSHLYDSTSFGDDVFDDEKWNSAYENMTVKFNDFINESTKKLKKYPIIIPPDNKEDCIDILIEDSISTLKDDEGELSFPGKKYKSGEEIDIDEIRKDWENTDLHVLQHEYIHAIQTKKYEDMWEGTPTDSEFWDNLFSHEKIDEDFKTYLSMPAEIMAYAFSWVKTKGTNDSLLRNKKVPIYDIYKEIGGDVYELFKHYVNGYEKYYR